MNIIDRMIYSGKCRCCGEVQVWDFGEASDSQEQLLNNYINERHNGLSKNAYCENCEGIIIHDFLFYGRKLGLMKAIENLKNN